MIDAQTRNFPVISSIEKNGLNVTAGEGTKFILWIRGQIRSAEVFEKQGQ